MSEVDNEFMEFLNKIKEYEPQSKVVTIPEVFGIQYKEVYITKWIAYLLRSKSLGVEILTAILSINNGSAIKINKIDKVYTEYPFDTKRRIDILIFTDKYLIGIENKIWSGEQENQTSDYEVSMKKIANTKRIEGWIGIYLHPEQNRTKSDHFNNVTYTQLYDKLKDIKSSECPDPFEKMMFEEFMMYVKECLYMSKEVPEITENAMLYAGNIELIQRIDSEYRIIAADVIEWLKERFKNNGYAVLNNPRDDKEKYIQLAPQKCEVKWRKINFHFEILWENSILIPGELKIEVHLENYNGLDEKLVNHFKLENNKERGDKNPLESKLLKYSFATKKEAKSTFDEILKVLESNPFRKRADKANECEIKD